jgi:hypothetical protein
MGAMTPPAIPPWLLDLYPPSRLGLLDHFRGLVDAALLKELSEADYGEDAEAHLAALEAICRDGDVPEVMHFEPLEVLQLTRWSEPEKYHSGEQELRRAHIARGFACTALLLAAARPEYYGDDEDPTVIQLIDSATVLGQPNPELTARFFTWLLGNCPAEDLAHPFYACGLLILTLLHRTGITEPQAAELCEWVIAEEAEARRLNENFIDSDLWLFGLGVIHLHDKWRSYLSRARDAAPFPTVAALANRLL